ncbi:MAG: hypothetical protein GX811_00460 [Lentisphaerae bacterium]|nr:hypothetical protein [Lentisphaerota bacterium]
MQLNTKIWISFFFFSLLVFSCMPNSNAATRTWIGGGGNASAKTAANWLESTVPVPGDDIVLDDTSDINMTWDLDVSVQSWTQDGYNGTVTIATKYSETAYTNLHIIGDCLINSGTMTHAANSGKEDNRLSMSIGGDLTIGMNGAIDVTGKGYSAGNGPGAVGSGYRGGSHGGLGAGNCGPCYGSLVCPVSLGSGGSQNPGGGAAFLNIAGTLTVNGSIAANGGQGNQYHGGAGGSVNIIAGAIAGTGTIKANGAQTTSNKGGGGRVAVAVTNVGATVSLFIGTVEAFGGGAVSGAGTVYLRNADQGKYDGTLIVDNNGVSGKETVINSNVTDTMVGNVELKGKSTLVIENDQILTVQGDWNNAAGFIAKPNSSVNFVGAPGTTSLISGSTIFMGVICTSPGKKLIFEEGTTQTIADFGRLILHGEEGEEIVLRSSVENQSWRLKVGAMTEQIVRHVSIKDSDASDGVEITAINSIDAGENINWNFINVEPGEINVWIGNSDTYWFSAANWSQNRTPLETDFVVIPSGCQYYPIMDAPKTLAELEIQQDASLSLQGQNLTVSENIVVKGLLATSGNELITLLGDADFTDSHFEPSVATIRFSGLDDQEFNGGGLYFYRIEVLNESGTVEFVNSFSAEELVCEAPDGIRDLRFKESIVVEINNLIMRGQDIGQNIFLRGLSDGQRWNLKSVGYRSVRGVDVKDCDASSGFVVNAINSKDSGNNLNWEFNPAVSVWTGDAGNNFNTSANWIPEGVPSENSRVLVDSPKAMVISSPVTLLELTVGGGIDKTQITVQDTLTVSENIIVLTNATLILNKPSNIENNLIIAGGGLVTHSGNSGTDVNKIDLTVQGNVFVDLNGAINADGRGYSSTSGPGGTGTGYRGGSHGGRGAGNSGPCYGSIIAPTNLGSGGSQNVGGGAVLLKIDGILHNNGVISANGGTSSNPHSGAGGSVFVKAGAIKGFGFITANGGNVTSSIGGGGRVSVIVTNQNETVSNYKGMLTAYAGVELPLGISSGNGGAGTVYTQNADQQTGQGCVFVGNNNYAGAGFTDVPSLSPSAEVRRAVFHVADATRLRLTDNFTVGDIWLLSENAKLDLAENTLSINSKPHTLLPGTVDNYGVIIWVSSGTLFKIR